MILTNQKVRWNKFVPATFLSGVALSGALLALPALAQEANPTSVQTPSNSAVVTNNGDIFFYKVHVVRRDITAINYLHRSGSTDLKFVGTELLPGAEGKAEVKSERGGIHIHAEFRHLTPANGFGPEYLTYVLWAISPDGRPQNLGEVLPAGTSNNIEATTSMQAFGLIVTAEPYYAVSTPSDVVVLKNEPSDRTNGIIQPITAHATLLPRGTYTEASEGSHTNSHPITRDEHSPLELYEAYNAVRIAEATGAEKYSPDIFGKAEEELKNAADMDASKHRDEKMEITYARGAVQRAEDARIDTLRKQAAERTRETEEQRDQAQTQAANSQAESQQAQADAARAREQAEQANQQAKQAQEATEEARKAKEQADAEAAQARAQAAQANQEAQSAQETREKLRNQLNSVLQTTETARGLIVNMSDVLFDTGKYTLKQGTQISLAKVAGILEAYPSLKVQVEGYTDSTGSPAFNQTLSENRAGAVRNFLVQQGVPQDSITSKGFGATDFVADNGTARGRAQNRRVNMVVSGQAIGVEQTEGPADADQAQPRDSDQQQPQNTTQQKPQDRDDNPPQQ